MYLSLIICKQFSVFENNNFIFNLLTQYFPWKNENGKPSLFTMKNIIKVKFKSCQKMGNSLFKKKISERLKSCKEMGNSLFKKKITVRLKSCKEKGNSLFKNEKKTQLRLKSCMQGWAWLGSSLTADIWDILVINHHWCFKAYYIQIIFCMACQIMNLISFEFVEK